MKSTCFFIEAIHFFYLKSLVIAVLLSITMRAEAQTSGSPEPVPLPGSELRKFHSEIMDQDFQIFVQLPLNYIADGSVKYPVWYMTDGNRSFPMTANISTILGFPPAGLPQVIVVGIAYEIKDMSEWAKWRTRDLTPVEDRNTEEYWNSLLGRMTGDTTIQVKTGGAPRLLSFISDELIPFIESEYHVSPEDRTLGGYSYGGLFTLFALFEQPALFQRYFAGSPTIVYADGVLFELEKTMSESHTDLRARLFMSFGQSEDQDKIAAMKKMAGVLESRHYPSLEVRTHIFEGESHVSAYAASVMRAFTTLYGK